MIENKNQLKKALKEGKIAGIKRIYNFDKNNKIPEGTEGKIEHIQSNAFTVKYPHLEKACWTYLDGYDYIEIKGNKITYFQFVSETFDEKKDMEKIKSLENQGAYIWAVTKNHKINKDYGKTRNFYYIAMFPYIINEIIEK